MISEYTHALNASGSLSDTYEKLESKDQHSATNSPFARTISPRRAARNDDPEEPVLRDRWIA
jgi:hypothetical protein